LATVQPLPPGHNCHGGKFINSWPGTQYLATGMSSLTSFRKEEAVECSTNPSWFLSVELSLLRILIGSDQGPHGLLLRLSMWNWTSRFC
jgi:hypothetical protein